MNSEKLKEFEIASLEIEDSSKVLGGRRVKTWSNQGVRDVAKYRGSHRIWIKYIYD